MPILYAANAALVATTGLRNVTRRRRWIQRGDAQLWEVAPAVRALGEESALARGFQDDRWLDSLGPPIYQRLLHPRTCAHAWNWADWAGARLPRGAFIQLTGQEGVAGRRAFRRSHPPRRTTPNQVLRSKRGDLSSSRDRGLATVAPSDGGPSKSVEWQPHSMFRSRAERRTDSSRTCMGDTPRAPPPLQPPPARHVRLVAGPEISSSTTRARATSLRRSRNFYAEAKVIRDPGDRGGPGAFAGGGGGGGGGCGGGGGGGGGTFW
jgi:hypothetical protein